MTVATIPTPPVETLNEAQLREVVGELLNNEEILVERLADVELALDDRGWESIYGSVYGDQFSRDGLKRAADLCRVMTIVNPLIKAGSDTRNAYVFGQGVQIVARSTGEESTQDVASIVQEFLDDKSNVSTFSGDAAHEENERVLYTDGNLFYAFYTTRVTGRVEVRVIPFDEIKEVIYNPEDRSDPWLYRRTWTQKIVQATQDGMALTMRVEERTVYHPHVHFRPKGRKPKTLAGHEILWEAPLHHVKVNALQGWDFGIGDAFAATFWAKGYKEFLEDWAKLVKALSRFAWRATAKKKSAAQDMRARIAKTSKAVDPATGINSGDAGQTAVMTEDMNLEAIPKTGATIDSESGKPLAAMAASALGLPVTQILADPGTTGARAVAETLSLPQRLKMMARRTLHANAFLVAINYVIDAAIRANRLSGAEVSDSTETTERWELTDETDRVIDIVWPDLEEEATKDRVAAIVEAWGTGIMDPLTIVQLLLQALGVSDVDELLEKMRDEDGNFIDPRASAMDAAVAAFRQGRADDQSNPASDPEDEDEDEDEEQQ